MVQNIRRDELISIHILRVEDDKYAYSISFFIIISIHILRVEDDPLAPDICIRQIYFNPHPPCGG